MSDETLQDAVISAARAAGLDADDCEVLDATATHDISMRCDLYQISVTQSVPFAEDDYLQVALDTFSLESAISGPPSVDESISACTHISVQKVAPASGTEPESGVFDTGTARSGFNTSEEAMHAMALAKSIALLVVDETEAESVFWGPSTFLLSIADFKRLATSGDPLLLYLHCHVYPEFDKVSGRERTGVVASGAQWLIGYNVAFQPSNRPAEYLVEKLYDFVRLTLKSGGKPEDGVVFEKEDGDKTKVGIHAADGTGPDKIELSVMETPDIAAHVDRPADLRNWLTPDMKDMGFDAREDEGKELDPEDPVDAAILERLAELNAENTAPETEEQAPVEFVEVPVGIVPEPKTETLEETDLSSTALQGAEAEIPAETVTAQAAEPANRPRPHRRPSQKMSMAELRDFAREAQVATQNRDVDTKKRGLIGKMFNKKSG
ncbi:hypothetical protein [uncultured Roseibium sp.]|uniref:hypothetical protein n=1 Tax=uncultured Roseibium sp. TaxID=1936171 RepID=UPI002607F12C|nr:hypothetical protein [uncultured Roseibium sp.]